MSDQDREAEDMSEIANCPYCGCEAVYYAAGFVGCSIDPCGAQGPQLNDKADAIARWNEVAGKVAAHRGLVDALELARPTHRAAGCWCPYGYGHVVNGPHSERCLTIRAALAAARAGGKA